MLIKEVFFKNNKKEFNEVDILSKLFEQRCLTTDKEIEEFLNPKLEKLYDPLKVDDIFTAVEIILTSVKKNEKILIYGDYDVDGTTSIALLVRFLKNHFDNYLNIFYEVANRFEGGYGFSNFAAERAIQNKINLIITVDCGIKDFETIAVVKKAGIKVIVIDHHEVDKKHPHPADIVLDLKKTTSLYLFRELSACGLTFKLISAILIRLNKSPEEAYKYLDLVGLSTACDLVPLINENRILMYYGLKKINKKPILGLKKMVELYNLQTVDMNDILFKLGPSINAAGRLDSAKIAVDFLLTNDEFEAEQLAKQLNRLNNDRKKLCNQIVGEIKALCEDNKKKSIVLFNEKWHQGVLGIIAAKCLSIKYCPTVIMTKRKDNIIGSVRSIPNVDIYSILEKCSNLLNGFGGHKMAAGFTLKPENLDLFRERFEEEVEYNIGNEDISQRINVDFKIDLENISKDFFYTLKEFEPFGIGNETPIFASEVTCEEYTIEYNTLFIKFEKNGVKYFGIGYDLNDKECLISDKKSILLVFEFKTIIEEDVILNIKDIKNT